MSSALFSSSWYRVASLTPSLRGQARIVRHHYRGQRWFVLQDLATGRFMRLNAQAYGVVALMDGQRSLEEIWQIVCEQAGDEAPTQDEILQLLTQLHQANVLLTDEVPDMDELDTRRKKLRWTRIKQYLGNPLSLKFPLIDPDRFLGWMVRLIPRQTYVWILLVWAALVGAGVVGAVMNWNELTHDITARIFTAQNLLLLALAFPVLKAIHEFGHGLAIKMLGGSCHEMGVMLLVAVPVPYVDASQSSAFVPKTHRMLVGLAGMMAELAVASVALGLWIMVSPGLGKAFLHQVVILAGVTTIVFNANPLLRFDGYYVLADWLEIPNLGQKSNQYLGYLINKHLFGVREGLPLMLLTPREAPWLLTYAISSFVYRMVVAVLIVWIVAQQFFFIGVLLAVWSMWNTVGAPMVRNIKYLSSNMALHGNRLRAWAVSGGVVGVVALILAVVPVPAWTSVEGVVWMADAARVRSANPCFAQAFLATPGTVVKAGQPLLTCADEQLNAREAEAQARVDELQARWLQAQANDRVQAQLVQSEMEHAQQRLNDVRQRRDQLTIYSPHAGRFISSAEGDFVGRFFQRGDTVGYVLDPERFSLLTVVGQGDVDVVRSDTQRVELRFAQNVMQIVPARIEREVPAATTQLPSLALGLPGGGKIGLDPNSSAQDPQAWAPLFQFELKLLQGQTPVTAGQRVYVHFVHSPQPLAQQVYRAVRQLFMRTFAT